MIAADRKVLQIAGIFTLATLVAFVVLNRWAFMDIGMLSFGRVWQFYVSYEDFGFVRRALLGTVFSITGLNDVLKNEYHFALLVQHLGIVALSLILFAYVVRRGITDLALVATIALSPALIIHSGYTTGSLDVFILILVALNILFCRNLAAFCAVLVAGTVMHELFVFTIPAQFVAYFLFLRERGTVDLAWPATVLLAATLISIGAVVLFGTPGLPEEAFEAVMTARLPFAAGQHGLWSGYYEIASSPSKYVLESIGQLTVDMASGAGLLSVPLIYAVLVWARLLASVERPGDKLMMLAAVMSPLFVSLLATDFYRWIGLSAGLGLLLTLLMVGQGGTVRHRLTYILLPFCLLAPLGAAQIDRPFPLHQFVLERLL